MILIPKDYVEDVRRKYPDVTIKRTVHKYYIEETKDILDYICFLSKNKVHGGAYTNPPSKR